MTRPIQSYTAPWFMREPHLQTLLAYLLRPKTVPERHPLEIDTPDNDRLVIEQFGNPDNFGKGQPIVLMLHGLEGCARSSYILELAHLLLRENIQPVALNFRSCGGYLNKRKRTYHAGETDDLSFVLDWIDRNLSPDSVSIVGFSLGGNVMLKYLGERGRSLDYPLDAAVAISIPFDLEQGAHYLMDGLSKIYDLHFLTLLKQTIQEKNRTRPHDYDLKALHDSNSLYDFDDKITAPIHGFKDAKDYYQKASCEPFLDEINIPTIVLQSRDDPLIPFESVPTEKLKSNRFISPVFTDHGGHVGFVEHDSNMNFSFWAERQAKNFITATINHSNPP